MSNYKVKAKAIRFKSKCLLKTKEVNIRTTSGITYIEAIPEVYKDELNASELEQLYNSFINLGKDLYNANKDNVGKITFSSLKCLNINPNGTLLNSSKITEKNNLINMWLQTNNLHKSDLYNSKRSNLNYLIIKNGKWNSTDALYNWLLSNFIPDTNEAFYNDKYLVYDNGMLVDLSIFMYLVIHSILNQKAIDNGKKAKGPERFNDFMCISNVNTANFELNNYMEYLQEAMEIYDKQNIYILNRYDKLIFKNNEYKVIREYESLYGLLWYIFKINITELCTNTYDGGFVHLNICLDCGNPILSSDLRCDNCNYNNRRERKRKSRQTKKDNINRIKSLLLENKYPKRLVNEAINLLKISERNIECGKVKHILKEMEIYDLKRKSKS